MQKEIVQNSKKNRILFIIELFFAILLAIGCSVIGMSNLLWVSNDMLPSQTDLLGHLTKVIYLAEQLSEGHLPSWFPYWYNGSTTTQYYVPLSYYLMIPIYLATHNLMMTYKLFCVSMMTIGSLGVWAFCNKNIGRGCGLVGIILFSLQPILLESLYREGVVAQGPIYALTSWYLFLVLSCAKKPTRGKFFGTTLSVTLLIMSHAMHAYMICLATMIVLFVFILLKKITIRTFFITAGTIVFSGILTAFWSLVGVTGLENPGIPYLLPEAAADTTAKLQWFLPDSKDAFLHFSIEVLGLSVLGLFGYLICSLLKKNNENIKYYGAASLLLTFVTVILSFGYQIPGFELLPLASGLVPGRILTFTAVTGAISGSYFIYMIWNIKKMRFLLKPAALVMIVYVCIRLNPLVRTYPYTDDEAFHTMTAVVDNNEDAFEKGRYHWYSTIGSSEVYFSYLHNYNISNGWNIEGTTQNRIIYNNNIAFPIKEYGYILKEIALWNVKYLLLDDSYIDIMGPLKTDLGFEEAEENREGLTLLVNDQPSSYYLLDHRNALIVSDGLQGLSINFPNLVQGKSENLWDYSEEELQEYDLIYIIEPTIDSRTDKSRFEKKVTDLVNTGVKVIIEAAPSNIFDIFGVQTKDEVFEGSPNLTVTELSPIQTGDVSIDKNSYYARVRGLYGLDEVYADFKYDNSDIRTNVLGTKKVGKGEVVFVGAHLSQYLSGVYVRNNGIGALNDTVKANSDKIKNIFEQLFQYYNVNEAYLPEVFGDVTEQDWGYDGGSFTYDSEQTKKVTVSVTYSPRWTAVIDGKSISLDQREHLITLTLPAGKHRVELHYGITMYGKIGYGISIFGAVSLLLFLCLWKWNIKLINYISDGLTTYLQIDKNDPKVGPDQELLLSSQETSGSREVPDPAGSLDPEKASIDAAESEIAAEQEIAAVNTGLSSLQEDDTIIRREINHNGIVIEIMEINDEIPAVEADMEA